MKNKHEFRSITVVALHPESNIQNICVHLRSFTAHAHWQYRRFQLRCLHVCRVSIIDEIVVLNGLAFIPYSMKSHNWFISYWLCSCEHIQTRGHQKQAYSCP